MIKLTLRRLRRIKGCESKKAYPTKEHAEHIAKVEHEIRGVKLRAYHCDYGPHYHLTHNQRNERQRRAFRSKYCW